eukprot:6093583-Pyramimonas_sp.AAC.1
MMVNFCTYLELQMSLRALWHRNEKKIMRHASLKYLDAWLGYVMSADAKQLVILCYVAGDGIRFLDRTRGADELESS